MNIVHVIGIGQGKSDLTASHLRRIREADLLVGGERHLALFSECTGETLAIKGDIPAVIGRIKDQMDAKKIVVLASGDPLFHGIGATLARSIPMERLRIHPNITAVGAAFAAICQPWHDAKLVSLHSRTGHEFGFPSLACENKVAFLTGPSKDPVFIGKQLMANGLDGFRVCVLENLGHPDKEKITWFTDYRLLAAGTFSHPNIVILIRAPLAPDQAAAKIVSHETYTGMPDDFFRHSRGLITKSEIRALSLSRLRLTQKDHVLWDIGSGSGSVGIEAAIQLPWGQVYAVEKNKTRLPDIIHNVKNFEQPNVKVVNLNFPEGHETLKTPDRIFIGGGGQGLDNILDCCCNRIKTGGIIVVNTVVMESMDTAMRTLTDKGFTPEMIQVQISRAKSMPYGNRLDALNPVWIISGRKPKL
ncbi:MAG: precorrin-6y C5,15-methyltransferase (decarboxylating) subunit CbiE [Desulfobacter sp.]|nr:MAG: precorrin-6y C5,15-methyltransferase (decarboxylating) subunit CbiE [Desulfobacter sp.]